MVYLFLLLIRLNSKILLKIV